MVCTVCSLYFVVNIHYDDVALRLGTWLALKLQDPGSTSSIQDDEYERINCYILHSILYNKP